jgi:hypothetical protein
MAPLRMAAGDPGIGKSAAVARALIDGHQFDRLELPDILQRQFQRTIDLALDLEGEFIRIDIERHAGQMIADEKGIVRRDRAVIEDRKWHLKLRRPAGQADHRPLLRIFHQRPFAVVERHRHRIERERPGRTETCCKCGQSGTRHHLSSIEHRASSEAFW